MSVLTCNRRSNDKDTDVWMSVTVNESTEIARIDRKTWIHRCMDACRSESRTQTCVHVCHSQYQHWDTRIKPRQTNGCLVWWKTTSLMQKHQIHRCLTTHNTGTIDWLFRDDAQNSLCQQGTLYEDEVQIRFDIKQQYWMYRHHLLHLLWQEETL